METKKATDEDLTKNSTEAEESIGEASASGEQIDVTEDRRNSGDAVEEVLQELTPSELNSEAGDKTSTTDNRPIAPTDKTNLEKEAFETDNLGTTAIETDAEKDLEEVENDSSKETVLIGDVTTEGPSGVKEEQTGCQKIENLSDGEGAVPNKNPDEPVLDEETVSKENATLKGDGVVVDGNISEDDAENASQVQVNTAPIGETISGDKAFSEEDAPSSEQKSKDALVVEQESVAAEHAQVNEQLNSEDQSVKDEESDVVEKDASVENQASLEQKVSGDILDADELSELGDDLENKDHLIKDSSSEENVLDELSSEQKNELKEADLGGKKDSHNLEVGTAVDSFVGDSDLGGSLGKSDQTKQVEQQESKLKEISVVKAKGKAKQFSPKDKTSSGEQRATEEEHSVEQISDINEKAVSQEDNYWTEGKGSGAEKGSSFVGETTLAKQDGLEKQMIPGNETEINFEEKTAEKKQEFCENIEVSERKETVVDRNLDRDSSSFSEEVASDINNSSTGKTVPDRAARPDRHSTMVETFVLEKLTSVLEQLESNVLKQSGLVEELSEEKRKNQKLQDQLNFSQETLKIAEESTDHLKDSIGRKSAELVKQYDWSKESQVKLESKVRTLQRELEEAQSLKQRDKTEIVWRLEREEKRVRELEDMLAEKKEELAEVRKKTGKASVNQTRAEEKVQEESRLRIDVEQRNKVLEEEMTKQWTQLKDSMTKLSASESAKQDLEVQLEKQTNEMRQRYNEIQQVQAETNATTSTLSLVQQRAQAAEHKIPELQQQLDEKSLRLQATEAQLRDLATTKVDLRTSKDDINRLKAQLHEERMEKSLLTQQLDDTKQQLAACLEREERLRHENTDMKHRLMQTQNKLYATEDKSKSVEDMHSLAEQGKKSLLDQVSSLQQEVQRLQSELMQTAQRLNVQIKKHDEQKTHHKNKIQQAREIFSRHKLVLADSLMKLQQDLNMTNAELQKEQNNRENLQKKHDSLLEEHRKLLAMHSDTEEAVQDQNRNVSTMDYRVKYLERENSVLQDRIDTLSRQRVAMEKLMREYRLEKQKLEIDKSLFASSTPGGYVLPSSPLSTLNSVPKSTLTSGLGLSQSRNYISTLDAGPTNGFSTRLSQSGTRTPGFGHSPTNRESLPSPVLSSDNDND